MKLPHDVSSAALQTSLRRLGYEAVVDTDHVINQTRRQIDLLREYRTRLIADVVTGKLDVREAATALPEVDSLTAEDILDDIRAFYVRL